MAGAWYIYFMLKCHTLTLVFCKVIWSSVKINANQFKWVSQLKKNIYWAFENFCSGWNSCNSFLFVVAQ